jgi:heat shock protein HslJ
MKQLSLMVMLAAVCVMGAACGAETAPAISEGSETVTQPDFESVLWRLVELRSETGEMASVLDQTTVDVKFIGTEMGGTAGCNRYFGTYSLGEANQLTLGSEMGSTQMACAPEVMEQEQRYFALLSQVAAVTRIEDQLILEDADSASLLKFMATEPATLEDTEWQASGINNGKGGVVSTATTSLSTAVFSEGQLSGTGGCNPFTATYETDGDQITIGPAAATRKFCNEPEGIMDQEQQYFEALGRARTFSLTPEELELRDEDGALQVGFRPTGEQ